MAKKPEPWWREDRGAWFVQINRKRYNLGPKKKEAFQRFYELMAQPQKRQVDCHSVLAIIDVFLEWCQNHLAPATYEWYRYRLQDFVGTIPANLSVGQFKPYHVTKWIDGRKSWSSGSKRNACRSIQRAMKWAVEEGLIDNSPVAHMKKPKGGKRELVVSPEVFDKILSLIPDREFHDLLSATWETGCRPQESLRVEARHVDLVNSRWVFPATEAKGDVPRAVYLTDVALDITKRLMLRHPQGRLFRNSTGAPWTKDAVNCAFVRIQLRMGKRRMQEQGIDVDEKDVKKLVTRLSKERTVKGVRVPKTESELRQEARRKHRHRLAKGLATKYNLYALRHSWATHALQRGVDALTVAVLMGHQDPSTLAKVYQHLSHNPEHLLEQARKAAS